MIGCHALSPVILFRVIFCGKCAKFLMKIQQLFFLQRGAKFHLPPKTIYFTMPLPRIIVLLPLADENSPFLKNFLIWHKTCAIKKLVEILWQIAWTNSSLEVHEMYLGPQEFPVP